MSASWWVGNLMAYSVQVALLVLAGGFAATALRLKQPRVMLAYWQALLAACLLLPLVESWQRSVPAKVTGVIEIAGRGGSGARSLSLVHVHDAVLLVVAAGVVFGLLRLALGLLRLSDYQRNAQRILTLPGALRQAQEVAGVEAAFYFSNQVGSPVTLGWLDPAVIIPSWFERMDESQQSAIACHELLHVARRDWLMNFLEEVVLTLFWFHPAVWWVVRTIRLSREQVVDSEVVALTGARKCYLEALLEIAAARAVPALAPLFLVENQLARRVASLVKEVRMSKPRLIASLAIALAVVTATGWWGVKTFWLAAPVKRVLMANAAPTTRYDFTTVYSVGGDVTSPIPIYKPEPPYTKEARAAKLEGTCNFSVVVDENGNVADVRLVRSVGGGLDESAIETIRTWKFKPATKKGEPVPVRVMVEVTFRLF